MANAFSELYQGITGVPSGVKSIINTGKTQYYNATGQQVPGYNTTNPQLASSRVGGNNNTYTIGDNIYNAAGDPVGKTQSDTTKPPGTGPYDPSAAAQATQTAQDKANAIFGIDSGLTSANDALGRLQSQQDVGYGNLDREAQSAYDQLNANNTIASRDYTTSRTGQVNDYVNKQAQNDAAARSFLDAGRRTLGTQGAGGGSAARYALPFEAQQQANGANSADQAVNNKNLIALDTNYQDTQDKYKNAQNDVANQRVQGRADLESKVANQRATLLSTIAQLTGQKNIANGGDYKSAANAASGYTSQIPALLDRINTLSATPAITPQTVTTTAPTLAAYNYAQPVAAPTPTQDASLNNPVIAAILGLNQQQDKNQLQPAFA